MILSYYIHLGYRQREPRIQEMKLHNNTLHFLFILHGIKVSSKVHKYVVLGVHTYLWKDVKEYGYVIYNTM